MQVIHVDGMTRNNGSPNSEAACRVTLEDGSSRTIELPRGSTNNLAELHAIREGLRSAKELSYSEVTICSDSLVALGWVRHHGSLSKKMDPAYAGAIRLVCREITALILSYPAGSVQFRKVTGAENRADFGECKHDETAVALQPWWIGQLSTGATGKNRHREDHVGGGREEQKRLSKRGKLLVLREALVEARRVLAETGKCGDLPEPLSSLSARLGATLARCYPGEVWFPGGV